MFLNLTLKLLIFRLFCAKKKNWIGFTRLSALHILNNFPLQCYKYPRLFDDVKLWEDSKYWSVAYWKVRCQRVELVRNLVAHGDAREGKWRWNWRMEWVASTLTPSPNVVYPALLKLMRTSRLPAVDWTDVPRRFKWTRPFRGKTKSGFCACAITFHMSYTCRDWSRLSINLVCLWGSKIGFWTSGIVSRSSDQSHDLRWMCCSNKEGSISRDWQLSNSFTTHCCWRAWLTEVTVGCSRNLVRGSNNKT